MEYHDGEVAIITAPEKCVLFKKGCQVTLSAQGGQLTAHILNGGQEQRLTATISQPNSFGGIHIQHTGSTGASATVIQSINNQYH